MKQTKVPLVGAFKETFIHTAVWLGLLNFALIAITAYWTTLRQFFLVSAPWVKIWMFLGFLVFILVVMMVVEYKFIMPSYYAFRGRQFSQHDATLKDMVKNEVERRLNEGRNNNTPETP